MYRYLSIWELQKNGEVSNTIAEDRLLHDLQAISPDIPSEETLSFLQRVGIVESFPGKGFRLSNFGIGLRKIMPNASTEVPESIIHTPGQWNDFRKLVAYYLDCITADGKRQICVSPHNLGKSFVIPTLSQDWLVELDATAQTITHVFSPHELPFQYAVENLDNQDMELCLGYPIGILRRKDGSLNYLPVTIIPTEIVKCSTKAIQFRLKYDECEINPLWLMELVSEEQQKPLLKYFHETGTGRYQGLLDLKKALPLLEAWMQLPKDTLDPTKLETSLSPTEITTPIANAPILFLHENARYTSSLQNELKIIAQSSDEELDKTALAYLFRKDVIPCRKFSTEHLPLPFIECNQEQRLAVANALCYPISKVTGPPGTGKSQVAVNVIANLLFEDRSVIFTSKNHKAVQAIEKRSRSLLKSNDELSLLNFCNSNNQGVVLNWTSQDLGKTLANAHDLEDTVDMTQPERVAIACREWMECEFHLAGRMKVMRRMKELSTESTTQEKNLQLLLHLRDQQPLAQEHLLKLKKIFESLSENPSQETILAHPLRWLRWKLWGRRSHERALKTLKEWYPEFCFHCLSLPNLRLRLKDIIEASAKYDTLLHEIAEIETLARQYPDTSHAVEIMDHVMKELTNATLQDALLAKQLKKLHPLQTNTRLRNDLAAMIRYGNHRKKATIVQRQEFANAFQPFLDVYPAWAVTLLSLHRATPCLPGIVDTVIIDEASQCDIVSIIPALYRAKHLVAIGDPDQFPPVITLNEVRHAYLRDHRHQLTMPLIQAFDYMLHTAYSFIPLPPTMLLEHFRCHKDIAAYCNREYYHGMLIVRTERKGHMLSQSHHIHAGVQWINVKDSVITEGTEAVRIVRQLRSSGFMGTIGVISPLRKMAMWLREMMYGLVNPEDVNTVNSFQGGERDIILFVLGYVSQLKPGQRWYLEASENRYIYNVAVSRAKTSLVLIGDRQRCATSGCSALCALAELPYKPQGPLGIPCFESPWEEKFFLALKNAGLNPQTQYPLAGRRLDMAVILGDIKLDIEVDGIRYHADEMGNQNLDDVFRDLQIEHAGWHVLRFWVYQLRDDMDECVRKVQSIFHPITQTD